MKIYFVPLHEFQFLTCFETQTLGLYKELSLLTKDDKIVFLVDKKIGGYASISRVSFENQLIELDFYYIFEKKIRLPFQGHIHDILHASLGLEYHGHLNSICSLGAASSCALLKLIHQIDPSYNHYQNGLEEELYRAEKDFKCQLKLREQNEDAKVSTDVDTLASEHTKAQYYLKTLASITGCDVWMASNDQHRSVNGETLKEGSLSEFPPLPLEQETLKRIKLIDTIWFHQSMPNFAFEIETTTSVFSGILRMGDLLAEISSSSMQLMIVAPEARRSKVLSEMNRPLFRKIGLTSACKFITLENLEKLCQNLTGLSGHVLPSVILAYAEDPLERG